MVIIGFIVANLLFWYYINRRAEPLYTLYHDYGFLIIQWSDRHPRIKVVCQLTERQSQAIKDAIEDIEDEAGL